MKQIIVAFIIAFTFIACSKEDKSEDFGLKNTSEAKAEYDNSNYGIYKGIYIGSSGVVIIDLSNSGNITAILTIDGTTYNMTTTDVIVNGQAVNDLTFTDGTNSFTFSVDANGNNPTVTNISINGSTSPVIQVVKETSTTIVKCYEGTYTGGRTGTFNSIEKGTSVLGILRDDDFPNDHIIATGTVSSNGQVAAGSATSGASFSGTLSGNTMSGTWANGIFLSGTWSGVRTL